MALLHCLIAVNKIKLVKTEKDKIDEEMLGEWGFLRFVHVFLLAQARGNGIVMPNVAEKRVFGVWKYLEFNEHSVKNDNIHETNRKMMFLRFD